MSSTYHGEIAKSIPTHAPTKPIKLQKPHHRVSIPWQYKTALYEAIRGNIEPITKYCIRYNVNTDWLDLSKEKLIAECRHVYSTVNPVGWKEPE